MRTFALLFSVAAFCALAARFSGPLVRGFDGSVAVHHVAGIVLTSDTGAPVILGPSHDGEVIVLGYTRCTDQCPLTLAKLAAALRSLKPGARPSAFFVTVEPQHDDVATLHRYLKAWGNRIVGVTGSAATLHELTIALTARDGGSRSAEHDTRIFIVNRTGEVEQEFWPGVSASEIRRSLICSATARM